MFHLVSIFPSILQKLRQNTGNYDKIPEKASLAQTGLRSENNENMYFCNKILENVSLEGHFQHHEDAGSSVECRH